MKLPLSWIREMVGVTLAPNELAHALTMSGTEVEGRHRVGTDWRRVVIARVDEISPVPGTDHLLMTRVDDGSGTHTVLTGAPNLTPGDRVPWVQPGGALPGGQEISSRRFRGIESAGMLCAADELGLGLDHDGIYLLEPDAPLGMSLQDYLDEWVFEFKITPNRPDTMNVIGVAREIAALLDLPLRLPSSPAPSAGPPIGELVQVAISDPDLCHRYSASAILGTRVGPSPTWMQRRLFLSGVRPISNVVDVTNYVMLELGQPIHAFDRARISGTITARRARAGESITTLDGQTRELPADTLVIADERGAEAVAGLMGGQVSEVTAETRDVVIEAANFERRGVRRTSRALRLSTEASKRFERGLDPEMTVVAAARAAELIAQLGGGTPAVGIADTFPVQPQPRGIATTAARVESLLGQHYPEEQIQAVLTRLGFTVQRRGDEIVAVVPAWRRHDVEGPADIAEEVARITGYEAIPNTLPPGRIPAPFDDGGRRWGMKARRALVSAGLQEVITYSLVDPTASQRLDSASTPDQPVTGIQIFNPLSPEHSTLRTTLLTSLLQTVRSNLRHRGRACLFELARVYLPPLGPLPNEVRRLSIAMTGSRLPESWAGESEAIDFFDLKGAVTAAASALGQRDVRWSASAHASLHPGQAASLWIGEQEIGFAGQLHPIVAERFGMEDRAVFVAELDFEALARFAVVAPPIVSPPRYPGLDMDVAAVVDDSVSHAELLDEIRRAGAPLLDSVGLFDIYRGQPIAAGQKSMAYALTYRAPDRTLTEEDAATVHQQIEQALASRFGAQIRGR